MQFQLPQMNSAPEPGMDPNAIQFGMQNAGPGYMGLGLGGMQQHMMTGAPVNMPDGQMPTGHISNGQMPAGQIPTGQIPTCQMHTGPMPPASHPGQEDMQAVMAAGGGPVMANFTDQMWTQHNPAAEMGDMSMQPQGWPAEQLNQPAVGQHGQPLSKTTVFVGGLPTDPSKGKDGKAFDEAVLHNIFFAQCGGIKNVRTQANRGFAFIEFDNEDSATAAIGMNGTQIALDPQNTMQLSKISVRPAYERPPRVSREGMAAGRAAAGAGWVSGGGVGEMGAMMQQQLELQQQQEWWYHQNRRMRERSPSPPRIPRFSENESRALRDSMKDPDQDATTEEFMHGVRVVQSWLEGGECTKRSADVFYSCLQAIHGKIQRLQSYESERKLQRQLEDQAFYQSLHTKSLDIKQALQSGNKQKVKDFFNKAQRKNLERWLTAASDLVVEAKNKSHQVLQARLAQAVQWAPLEEDMEVEADGMAAEDNAPPPAPPPPPPPSAAVGAADSQPGQGSEDAGLGASKRTKVEEESENAIGAYGRALLLESQLAEKQRKLDKLAAKVQALEAALAISEQKSRRAVDAEDAKLEGVLSASDPLVACTCASLSVFLAAQPYGARQSELTSYVVKLGGAGGASAIVVADAEDYVEAALSAFPGVFSRAEGSSQRQAADPVWSLSALHALQGLKKP